jgi:hypothetical protein
MQRDRQFDNAEPGAQMSARNRNGVDHLLTQFTCELRKLIFRKLAEIMRRLNAIE